jgi:hypothetical protein
MSKFIGNHQNNVIIVACCYRAFVSLLPPRSPALGLSYLKIKAHGGALNLVTRPQERVRVLVWGGGARVRAIGLGRWCVCVGEPHSCQFMLISLDLIRGCEMQ